MHTGARMGKQQTFDEIKSKTDRLGDLPVFSASINHICKLSTDPDADAMSLSQEALKDTNLSLTMKFVARFQNEHPLVNMDKLLMRAYIAALLNLLFKPSWR